MPSVEAPRAAAPGFATPSATMLIFMVLAAVVFVCDLFLPLGIAAGIPYIALMVLALWTDERTHVLLFAGIASLLTVYGYVLSPPGAGEVTVVANRVLTIGAVWTTAMLLYQRMSPGMAVADLAPERGAIYATADGPSGAARPHQPAELMAIAGTLLLAAAVLAFDLSLPLGVAGGVPYVAVVLLSLGVRRPRYTIAMAILGSTLTVAGYFMSPPGGIPWMVLTNRALALFAIWVSAVIVVERKRVEERLTDLQDDLERRVADQTRDLREAKQRAEDANRSKSQFLANMSHELRTPLNAIIGFADMMALEYTGPLNAKQKEYVGDIRDSGEHLMRVIGDILDLARIEAGKHELHEGPVDLAEVIKSARRLIDSKAREAGLDLHTVTAESPLTVLGDERLIRQMLLNLLSNAVKFTPQGGRIAVTARRADDGGIAIEVADSGIGMSPSEVEQATVPFFQADEVLNRRFEGTGLGLPLVKSLAELHGGHIEIRSVKGEGTTVRIHLPPRRTLTVN